jgi:hypothetical protein
MATAIALAYLVGIITSVVVGRSRTGLSQRGRLSMETIFGSLPWFLTQMVSMFAWPVFLCVWLVRGRPASPWKAITTGDGSIRVRRRVAN